MIMSKTYKGKYTPKNPKKYKGDPTKITYRSSWELQCMAYFDKNPDIIWWASEEMAIPYRSPIDGKRHRYFPDFIIKTSNGEVVMIEVKPAYQSRPPEKKSRVTKKYLNEVKTWGINQAKWKAAQSYCADRKWKFQVLTEDHLFAKRPK
jgi:hypothetical protein